jgi:hypothetical protein
MATTPTSMPDQGATPPSPGGQGQGGAPPPPPDQGAPSTPPQSTGAPANDMQMLLARWFQAAKQMASADPRLASGAQKVSEGIQEMQTALVTPPQPTPTSQQPQW